MQKNHCFKNLPRFVGGSLLLILFFGARAESADILWGGGSIGANQAWRTAGNWQSGTVPTSSDNAIFDFAGTNTIITIDMGAASGTQNVGSVTLGPNRTN